MSIRRRVVGGLARVVVAVVVAAPMILAVDATRPIAAEQASTCQSAPGLFCCQCNIPWVQACAAVNYASSSECTTTQCYRIPCWINPL